VDGDLPATEMALRIIEKRAKLLGLYPEQGKQSALAVSVTSGDGPQSTIKLEFVSPSLDRWRDEDADPPRPPPRDVSPQPEPRRDYAQPDPPIVVDATILPQNSGVPLVRPRKRSWMEVVHVSARIERERQAVTRGLSESDCCMARVAGRPVVRRILVAVRHRVRPRTNSE